MKRVIAVTGGTRGIGASVARLAVARGDAVCLSYLNDRDSADALVAELRTGGGHAMAVQADVSVDTDVARLFAVADAAASAWNGRLCGLVNNAGILERQSRIEAMDAARLHRIFSTNVVGSFLCCAEAVRRMSTRHGGQGGAIVNLSSRAARLGSPGEYVDYAASKAAIDTLTLGLAREVAAEGIRVNAVSPGIIYTGIHASGGEPDRVDRLKDTVPMKRGGHPDEVAKAVLWLLSDEASYTTGANIDVAGGR